MNRPPPPQDNDPIITQFKPANDQWELNDENIQRIGTQRGETILHNYCQYGINSTPIAVFKFLVETKGCDINAQDKNANTPLHYALIHFNPNNGGDVAVLTYLLNQEGVDANIKGESNFTLLHNACTGINKLPIEIFRCLIETHRFDFNVQDSWGSTPMHSALKLFTSSKGDIAVLTYLLDQEDVNVNILDGDCRTLFHAACGNIRSLPHNIFKLLVEIKGADVNTRDTFGNVPIHTAFLHFKPNAAGDITTLDYLLNQTNVNAVGKNGRNLLHLACTRGFTGPWGSSIWEIDTMWARIIEMIAERCVKLVLDEVAL
jgi:ankyrin repeat protein